MNRMGLVAALILGAMLQALFAPVLTMNFSWGPVQPRLVGFALGRHDAVQPSRRSIGVSRGDGIVD